MARTGDIYTAVEELKDLAVTAFSGLENEDDLDQLGDDLIAVRDKATLIVDVAYNVREALTGLAKK